MDQRCSTDDCDRVTYTDVTRLTDTRSKREAEIKAPFGGAETTEYEKEAASTGVAPPDTVGV